MFYILWGHNEVLSSHINLLKCVNTWNNEKYSRTSECSVQTQTKSVDNSSLIFLKMSRK